MIVYKCWHKDHICTDRRSESEPMKVTPPYSLSPSPSPSQVESTKEETYQKPELDFIGKRTNKREAELEFSRAELVSI